MSEFKFRGERVDGGIVVGPSCYYHILRDKRKMMIGDGVRNGSVYGYEVAPDTVELINNPLQERVEELENLTKKLKDGLDYFYGLSKRKEDYVSVPKELSEKQEAGLRASSIDFFGVQIFAVHKILVKYFAPKEVDSSKTEPTNQGG